MRAEEWGGFAALLTAVGALLKWGDSLWAMISGRSKMRIDEGESVFRRALDMTDRQAKRIEILEREVDELRGELNKRSHSGGQ